MTSVELCLTVDIYIRANLNLSLYSPLLLLNPPADMTKPNVTAGPPGKPNNATGVPNAVVSWGSFPILSFPRDTCVAIRDADIRDDRGGGVDCSCVC